LPVAAKRKPTAISAAVKAANGKNGPELAGDLTVGEGIALTFASALRSLRAGAARGDVERAQSLHRFRVGVRRLRSLLSAFSAVLPAVQRRNLSRELSTFAKRYSRTREWDVLISATLLPLAKTFPGDAVVEEIAGDAETARRNALPAEAALAPEAARIAAALEAAAFLAQPVPEQLDTWRAPLKDFVGKLLAKRHKRLRKRLKHLDLDDQAAFHQVRINVKKIRYPLELFRTLFDAEEVAAYLELLTRVQNLLGQLNDISTAHGLFAELPLSARAKGLIDGWLARDALAARDQFPAAARAFRRAESFW
jgi:triphosphatase